MSRFVRGVITACRGNLRASTPEFNNGYMSTFELDSVYTAGNLAETYSNLGHSKPAIKNADMLREALKSRFSSPEEAFYTMKELALQAREKEVIDRLDEAMEVVQKEVDDLEIQEEIILRKLDAVQRELNAKKQNYADLNYNKFAVSDRALKRGLEKESSATGWGRG